MDQFIVTGMSCAACQARVEKAVSALPQVTSCTVSLLTNTMRVEGEVADQEVIKAVEAAGYGARSVKAEGGSSSGRAKIGMEEEALTDRSTPVMKKRFAASLILLLILMYFSMGVHMLHLPLPAALHDDHVSICIIQMILAGLIMVINQKFFISGCRALIALSPNMDSLIALGATASFGYSAVMLVRMSIVRNMMGAKAAAAYMDDMYFESAAMILTLVTLGKTLESYSKGRTTDALKNLMKLAPKTANVIRDDREETIDIDEVVVGDIFVVRPGENIPVDGIVEEGMSAVNEAALTGESIPVDKEAGSSVRSGTLNQSGFLRCRATRVGADTTISQIIELVSDASATKAPVAKLADRISGIFVPVVILIAVISCLVWLFAGQTFGFALARAVSVLVVSCPCALGLATPVAIMVGNGVGAREGILFKTAEALQETGRIQTVALDKTGTLTSGVPKVTDVVPADSIPEEDLIARAASLEEKSEHPLAAAVTGYAAQKGIETYPVTGFSAIAGNGLEADLSGRHLIGGSVDYIGKMTDIPPDILDGAKRLADQGKTPMLFAEDKKIIGMIAVADTIRDDSERAVGQIRNMGIKVVMVTGDNHRTAQNIGARAGVDEVISGVLPEGKEEVIRGQQSSGKVAMVGDGINDAPALARADIGIAIGAGTDVAMDAADIVLMKSRLSDVAAAIRLSRRTYAVIRQNLFWALIYNVLLIPLACGVYSRWGITMSPAWGAAAMSCSSLFVVGNALRLNLFDIHDASADRKMVISKKGPAAQKDSDDTDKISEDTKISTREGEGKMTKTVIIEGMMCEHCEANVKKTLEAIKGIDSADVSHKEGKAVLEMSEEVAEETIKEQIEDKGYKFISIN